MSFAKDKRVIAGDILIDDGIHNLEASVDTEIPICFNQPWNKEWKGLRINKLEELIRYNF